MDAFYNNSTGLSCDCDGFAHGTLRIEGDAERWFAADPTRILHVMRYSAEQGCDIPGPALTGMQTNAPLLAGIDPQVVFTELDGMLVGKAAGTVILACADVLTFALPFIGDMAGCPQNTPYHCYDVLGHTARVIDGSPRTSLSRWAALFHDSGKPRCRYTDRAGRDHFKGHAGVGGQIADAELGRLGAPSWLREDVTRIVRLHEWFVPDTDDAVKQVLETLEGRVDLYRALLALQIADAGGKSPGFTDRRDAALRSLARLEALTGHAFGHITA